MFIGFRTHHIAITADFEKAFLMIGIVPSDRDVLKFLWFQDPTKLDSPIFHSSCVRSQAIPSTVGSSDHTPP